jgi:HrpA-like RNA helicase
MKTVRNYTPEILRANLADVILRMIDLRLGEPAGFRLLILRE